MEWLTEDFGGIQESYTEFGFTTRKSGNTVDQEDKGVRGH